MPDATQSRFSERSVPQRPEGDAFSDGGVGGRPDRRCHCALMPGCSVTQLLTKSI